MQTACQGKPFTLQLEQNSYSGEPSIVGKQFCNEEEKKVEEKEKEEEKS